MGQLTMFALLFMLGTVFIVGIDAGSKNWWLLTWDAEGADGRKDPKVLSKLRIPHKKAGLTIGRGYDLKLLKKDVAKKDMIKCGINKDDADSISRAAGMPAYRAKNVLKRSSRLRNLKFTVKQTYCLFLRKVMKNVVLSQRLLTKKVWKRRHWKIKGILLDLLFRGDYTRSVKRGIEKHIKNNSLYYVTKYMSDESKWRHVPKDRFLRRKKYMRGY